MKKFYKSAEAGTAPGGHVIRLDGKVVRTPLQNLLLLQSPPLAEAIAQEWLAQGAEIKPASMPLTQLANTMIDKANGPDRAAMNAEIIKYGGSDLICYFATHPADLVKLHQQHWGPLLAWMKGKHGIIFEPVSGIQYRQQPPAALDKLKQLIEGMDAAQFTIVQSVTASTGSVTIALALVEGRLSAEEAYQASCVDEIYQLKTWGADEPAQKKLEAIEADLKTIVRFRDLLSASS
jgi:chaperone required for assembly of F1-ATPase